MLEHQMSALASIGDPWTLLLLKVSRFSEIVETLGDRYGNSIADQVALRVRVVLNEPELLYELEDGTFAVVLRDGRLESAQSVARKINAAIRVPVSVEEMRLALEATVGIARYPDHGDDPATLARRAAVALYAARRIGRTVSVYNPQQDPYRADRLGLITDLRDAIRHEDVSVHFQPVTQLADGTVQGVEALARWEHPVHGSIPPDDFIPLAEETGLIEPLTRLITRQALQRCKEWIEERHEVPVAVNLSPRNLWEPDLVDAMCLSLASVSVPASSLKLEITESIQVDDPEGSLGTLSRLRDTGFRIAIDDFGMGYSSLSYLRRLPVDTIKMDRSFVISMDRNESNAAIVRAMIDLAHNLGLKVVAEGVETRTTWEMLKEWGCDLAQGYYISHPLPPEQLSTWLGSH